MSGQDMRNLMEMAMGQKHVYVIMYGDKPVRASLEKRLADIYADEYKRVTTTDPSGRKEITIHKIELF